MELIIQSLVWIHVCAGVVTLTSGPVAMLYPFSDARKHRLAGRIFYYAMLVVAITAILSFFKAPEQLFRQFLLGIALFVLGGILRGVRFILLMKGGGVLSFDWVYTALGGLNGVWMCSTAVWNIWNDGNIAFTILFSVFGFGALFDVKENIRVFSKPHTLRRLDWMRLHAASMLGAFTASTTAFTVNAASFLPWWAQWFGPTLLLLPFQFYFAGKIKALARHASGEPT